MADTRVKPSARLPGTPDTNFVAQSSLVDGSAFTADWLARMALEGRMYTGNAGTQPPLSPPPCCHGGPWL